MSDQKTVLFFPLNSPGHVNSSLGIADFLKEHHGYRTVFLLLGNPMSTNIVDHGHEMIVIEEVSPYEDYELAIDDDPTAPIDEEAMKKAGKTKVKFPGAMKWPQIIQRNQHLFKLEPLESFIKSMEMFEGLMVKELIDNHDNYAAAVDKIKPDMIIVDSYYIPPCIVNIKDFPWVRIYSANPIALTVSKLPDGVKPPPMAGYELFTREERARLRNEEPFKWEALVSKWKIATNKVIEKMGNVDGPLQSFMKKHGCPPLQPGEQAHTSPHINLYMFPRELDYDQDDDILYYPPRWLGCDSLTRRTLKVDELWSARLEEALEGKSELIYFSLGSIASGDANLMRRYIKLFETDQNRLYVVSKGVNGDSYELNSGNMIGANYVPQTLFLKRADLAIIHGGNNSVTECMYFGVPMIVLPIFGDQFDNAQRLQDLGLGMRRDAFNWTGEEFSQAIDEMLSNKGLRERVREIGVKMRARNDCHKISEVLHKLCQEKMLTQEFIDDIRYKDSF